MTNPCIMLDEIRAALGWPADGGPDTRTWHMLVTAVQAHRVVLDEVAAITAETPGTAYVRKIHRIRYLLRLR